jgi:gamma-glutamyltranspeptidase/glutathione hydrolase
MQTFFRLLFVLLLIVPRTFAASREPVRGKNGMVASPNDLATLVGVEILKKGGNAVDAAVAVGFALAVTYPAAGNLGGGGFFVIHLADGLNTTIDFREKAPLAATRDMFLDENGNFVQEKSLTGGLASGVPGTVAGLLLALEKYGTMPLQEVIQPAIDLAKDGFILSYHMARSFNEQQKYFEKYPSSRKIFRDTEHPFVEGELFIQTDLAKTLGKIRDNGRKGFYEGDVAEMIVAEVNKNGGRMTFRDLKNYNAVERPPVTGTYRGYEIVSMGPPSAGGIALIESLNALENFNFDKTEWGSSSYIFKIVEVLKHVFADRSKYVGDEDFVKVPKKWLLSKERGKEIFEQVGDKATPSKKIFPGKVRIFDDKHETTHYSIADAEGNAVSATITLNSWYGNKIVVDGAGFLLNNEMDDFSAKPGTPNQFGLTGSEANSIQPGKRMVSSMTPTIVLKDNKPFLVVGSPGGSTIITTVLQVILNVLDFNMNVQQAVDLPRFHHQWLPDRIDYERFGMPKDVKENLIKLGEHIGKQRMLGRVQAIKIDWEKGVFYGASDPRSFGTAEGI